MNIADIKDYSLVFYKNDPALVLSVDKKIDIKLKDGSTKKVRDKDIEPIHIGPLKSLDQIREIDSDPTEAWELLKDEIFTLEELSDFIFGNQEIISVYNTFLLVKKDLYFFNNSGELGCHPWEHIQKILDGIKSKELEELLFTNAIQRLKESTFLDEDSLFIREIEDIALGNRPHSRVLKELGIKETPQEAHRFLLRLGYWDIFKDPTAPRHNLTLKSPELISSLKEVKNPLDLTHLKTYAIDDEGSKDPDDAISIESENKFWVHITDIASIIPPNSPEDIEASGRGSNLYLPFTTVHMLAPEVTQVQGLGLTPENNTLSFFFELDSEMNIIKREIHLARVKVIRTTYSQVEENKDSPEFRTFYKIANKMKELRSSRGAISISLPEVKIRVQDETIQIDSIYNIESRDVVSEFMLLAGESAAIYARDNNIPIPYATQQPPDAKGLPEDNLAAMFVWRRKFKRGETQFSPSSHAGLGLELYTRATSPLRRYSDLIVNQQIRAHLSGDKVESEDDLLLKVMPSVEASRKMAMCERESNLYWKIVYLKLNPNISLLGTFVEKKDKDAGIFILEDLALETTIKLGGKDIELNQKVPLEVKHIDVPDMQVTFVLL